MGMKDKSSHLQNQGKEKMDQAREKAGQRGQQPNRQGRPQSERGGENHRDIQDTEQMEDRFDRDYDA
ncbi:hypothetical protein GCM10010521_52630 [Streptomyces rameus]|uniref:Uncharacterized protein n=1 Tax=Streptomyces rameus TaxID=68261 RepID=A0ABP6NUU1_9ACTN